VYSEEYSLIQPVFSCFRLMLFITLRKTSSCPVCTELVLMIPLPAVSLHNKTSLHGYFSGILQFCFFFFFTIFPFLEHMCLIEKGSKLDSLCLIQHIDFFTWDLNRFVDLEMCLFKWTTSFFKQVIQHSPIFHSYIFHAYSWMLNIFTYRGKIMNPYS
jgi:hypothetical protein